MVTVPMEQTPAGRTNKKGRKKQPGISILKSIHCLNQFSSGHRVGGNHGNGEPTGLGEEREWGGSKKARMEQAGLIPDLLTNQTATVLTTGCNHNKTPLGSQLEDMSAPVCPRGNSWRTCELQCAHGGHVSSCVPMGEQLEDM